MYAAGALAGDFSTAREETVLGQKCEEVSSPNTFPRALLIEVQDRADYAVRMALDAADTVEGAGGLTTYEPLCRTMDAMACPKL